MNTNKNQVPQCDKTAVSSSVFRPKNGHELLKLCKRNNNIKGIIYYSNYLKKRKEFRKMGELNIDFKSQKIDRDKIKFSKISYGLLFE